MPTSTLDHASNIRLLLAVIACAVLLFIQTFHPAWQPHLQTDIIIHHQQVLEYWQTGSWANISFKEYQPGALWFFVVPHLLAATVPDYFVYLNGTLFLNTLLLIAHGVLLWRYGPHSAVWVFLLLVAATGPILLYRFELIVSLFVLASWLLATRQRYVSAGVLVGLASITKLYPIVLLPVLAAEPVRQRQWSKIMYFSGGYIIGLLAVILPFLLFGGTIPDITTSLDTYHIKPVSLESIWGNILTLSWHVRGMRPPIDGAHGIQGIAEIGSYIPFRAYELAWIIPVTIFLLWIWYRRHSFLDPLISLLTLALFTLTAKILNPQYLWWFISFVPLLSLNRWSRVKRAELLITLTLALLLTQVIYPLNYSLFLEWFYGYTSDPTFVVLIFLRNGLLLSFLLLMLWHARHPNSLATSNPAL